MKRYRFPALLAIIISLAAFTTAFARGHESGGKIERSAVVDPAVTVTVCVMSGKITVHGWARNELRARAVDIEQMELRRIDKPNTPNAPPVRIDVMLTDKTDGLTAGDCEALGDVDLDVPLGATVQVQTRDGDIQIVGVAAAYAGSQNGDISIEKATRLVEAGSVGGSISLRNSSGRVNLSSAGGGVEASNITPSEGDDRFEVGTVSGDIQLAQVSNRSLVVKTVNGTVSMNGPLVHGGSYGFTTTSGDINLLLPADASFRLNAKISEKRTIDSDFSLKTVESWPTPPSAPRSKPRTGAEGGPTTPAPKAQTGPRSGPVVAPVIVKPTVVANPYALRRITAICGTGDALISVASFGGTLRLKKL